MAGGGFLGWPKMRWAYGRTLGREKEGQNHKRRLAKQPVTEETIVTKGTSREKKPPILGGSAKGV